MNAEFNWWLLIVGLVVGAGLVWLVVADTRRREADVAEAERAGEARWIAAAMSVAGRPVDDDDVLDVLRLHAAYLAAAPPDEASGDGLDDRPAAIAGGAPLVTGRDGSVAERRVMAHPIGPDRPDREGGPA